MSIMSNTISMEQITDAELRTWTDGALSHSEACLRKDAHAVADEDNYRRIHEQIIRIREIKRQRVSEKEADPVDIPSTYKIHYGVLRGGADYWATTWLVTDRDKVSEVLKMIEDSPKHSFLSMERNS